MHMTARSGVGAVRRCTHPAAAGEKRALTAE